MEKTIYQLLEEAIIDGKIKKLVIEKPDERFIIVEEVLKDGSAIAVGVKAENENVLQYSIATLLNEAGIQHTKLAEEAEGKVTRIYGDILHLND